MPLARASFCFRTSKVGTKGESHLPFDALEDFTMLAGKPLTHYELRHP